MQVNIRYLDNLKIEASFDDYKVISDQPIRYGGDGSHPGPYDYFLASSAMCAAYFVKVYCKTRNIPTDEIEIIQNNIVDPENRYKQDIKIEIKLPEGLSEKDKAGIFSSMERCTVKRVIQNNPEFILQEISREKDNEILEGLNEKTHLLGKDSPLETTIKNFTKLISDIGIKLEIASWRNPLPNVWSVHLRDADNPVCFSNGKGKNKKAALASALGEFLERLYSNYFFNDYYLGDDISKKDFVFYPDEKWFPLSKDGNISSDLMDDYIKDIYNDDLKDYHLLDAHTENERGVVALPLLREEDNKIIYMPLNILSNLFASNGLSAGNSESEAKVQSLSEIIERFVKAKIIKEEITLPDIPRPVLQKYPSILKGIEELEEKGYPLLIKDASLGGKYPVTSIALINKRTKGVYVSFGAHPSFEVALERTLTELMQGRSFEGLNVASLPPSFNSVDVSESNNIVEHFIDSVGKISWKFLSGESDFEYSSWDFTGTTEEEYQKLTKIITDDGYKIYSQVYKDENLFVTRIIVPGFSEIYEKEDLIWDNNNKARLYRRDILNIHNLSKKDLKKLLTNLEESELDDYMKISELILVNFFEMSPWGQLTVIELKILILLELDQNEGALSLLDMYATFNDNQVDGRSHFYLLLKNILELEENGLELASYQDSFIKMYGEDYVKDALKLLRHEIKFPGLTKTDMNLSQIEKHERLIKCYEKIHRRRE